MERGFATGVGRCPGRDTGTERGIASAVGEIGEEDGSGGGGGEGVDENGGQGHVWLWGGGGGG